MDGLSHLNIVKIIGFVEDIEKRIYWLVFPWEANGNVREFLLSGEWELPERVSLVRRIYSEHQLRVYTNVRALSDAGCGIGARVSSYSPTSHLPRGP